MYISRTDVSALKPASFISTEGYIIKLGEPEMALPDDGRGNTESVSVQRAIISYQDKEGNTYNSEGFIRTGTFKVGDKVPINYDPDNPGGSHRMIGEKYIVALWKLLLYAGGLMALMGFLELRPKRVKKHRDG